MRKARDFSVTGLTTAVLVAGLLALAACDSSDPSSGQKSPTAAHRNAKSGKGPKSAAGSAQRDAETLSEMVAAVSGSKGGPPVELKFVLTSRPEVGQVMDVDVAVVPRAPVPDSVAATFQVTDGLEIVDGSELERVEKLADGTPIRHVVRIRPKRDGIFTLIAAVSFTSSSLETTRTFSIPVIAGEGMPEQVAKGP